METTPDQPIEQSSPPIPEPSGRKMPRYNHRKLTLVLIVLVIIAAIPLTLFLVRQEQDIRQDASTGANFTITCQPNLDQIINLNGSREIRAVVRNKNTNQLVDGRTVIWSVTSNPGNWIASITTSSKTKNGIAVATIRSNPAVISTAEGIITAQVNGDSAAVCRMRAKNAQTTAVPPQENPTQAVEPTLEPEATPSPIVSPTQSTSVSITPNISPSVTPSLAPSQIPTPTNIPSPTTPPAEGDTLLQLSVLLHGIGISGDSVLPRPEECRRQLTTEEETSPCLSNNIPLHPVRAISIQIFNQQNQLIETFTNTVTYDNDLGFFTGTVNLGGSWISGPYLIKIQTPTYLVKQLQGIHTITAGSEYQVPEFDLVAADVNNNNKLEILDYNMIIECATYFEEEVSACSPEQITERDTNDDGIINAFDSNLFIRELGVQHGS